MLQFNEKDKNMALTEQKIATLTTKFSATLKSSASLDELEKIRIEYLGRKGILQELMHSLKGLPIKEKRHYGPLLNSCKDSWQELYETKKKELQYDAILQSMQKDQHFDVSAYLPNQFYGRLHPLTQLRQDVENIFISMGYEIADGPEVETEFYNFIALNIPEDHPARDMWDTFYLDVPHMLLRTHTSTVQIHTMQQQTPPIAIITPGRCYRYEATDASHDFTFHQLEGLFIDTTISLSNLLATMKEFLHAFFKKDTKIRVRPSYFPFVEPGIEIDGSCPFCTKGCSVCKKTGWIELGGAGLVHPNVLECSNIDPKKFSGFAFGFGLTRLAMLKLKIHDIRLLHSAKMKFLEQF